MTRLIAAACALTLVAGAAYAQTPAKPAAPAAKTTTTASKTAPVAHTAEFIDCSKQADAKGLHGKARKTFRSSCKAAGKKG